MDGNNPDKNFLGNSKEKTLNIHCCYSIQYITKHKSILKRSEPLAENEKNSLRNAIAVYLLLVVVHKSTLSRK